MILYMTLIAQQLVKQFMINLHKIYKNKYFIVKFNIINIATNKIKYGTLYLFEYCLFKTLNSKL